MEEFLLKIAALFVLIGAILLFVWFGGRSIRFPRADDPPGDKRLLAGVKLSLICVFLLVLLSEFVN